MLVDVSSENLELLDNKLRELNAEMNGGILSEIDNIDTAKSFVDALNKLCEENTREEFSLNLIFNGKYPYIKRLRGGFYETYPVIMETMSNFFYTSWFRDQDYWVQNPFFPTTSDSSTIRTMQFVGYASDLDEIQDYLDKIPEIERHLKIEPWNTLNAEEYFVAVSKISEEDSLIAMENLERAKKNYVNFSGEKHGMHFGQILEKGSIRKPQYLWRLCMTGESNPYLS